MDTVSAHATGVAAASGSASSDGPGAARSSSAAASDAAAAHVAAPPAKPSRSWARHLNLTNALTTLFLAYSCFSMYTLYRIAVPTIPSPYTAEGVRKPTFEPLWLGAAQAGGLALEVRLSTTGPSHPSAPAPDLDDSNSVLLFRLRDLPYAWNLSDYTELDLSIELPSGYDAVTTEVVGYDTRTEMVTEAVEEQVEVEDTAEVEGAGAAAAAVATTAEAAVDAGGAAVVSGSTGAGAAATAPARKRLVTVQRNVSRTVERRVPRVARRAETVLLPTGTAEDYADVIAAAAAAAGSTAASASTAGSAAVALPVPPSALQRAGAAIPTPVTSTDLNVSVSMHPLAGVRVRCRGEDADVSAACRRTAAGWRKAHQGSKRASASGASSGSGSGLSEAVSAEIDSLRHAAHSVVRRGFLPSLAHSISRTVRGWVHGHAASDAAAGSAAAAREKQRQQEEGEDDETLTARERALGGLVVLESSSPGARRVATAIAGGRQVTAHAVLRWQDSSQKEEEGGKDVRSPLAPEMRRVHSSAAMVAPAPYQPASPIRYLWLDLLGGPDSPRSLTFARWVGIGEDGLRRAVVMPAVGDEKVRKAVRKGETVPSTLLHGSSPVSSSGGLAPAPPASAPGKGTTLPHWLGSLSLSLVMQTESIPKDEVPPAIRPFLTVDETRTGYVPALTANPVRPLRERYVPLNSSVVGLADALPLKVRLTAVSAGTWRLMSLMDQSLTTQRQLGASERDTDDVIRLLAETPLWLLSLTFAVSFIHLLFDALAFKNDVAFWSSAKSLRGISVRSLSTQLVSQLVISLYLWREGSSALVLLPQAAGTLLLVWKMGKAAGLGITLKYHVLPLPTYDQALAASATEGPASVYDREAVTAMSAVLYPLLAGYAAYTLVYAQHTSWADWALGTAVSAVYGFGFALMTPQLWINYRLRSVAHLPWRVLGYRFFNTVIDDLFAAIIRMPLLHRISVFRDDVIFLIYMGQRWYYPVDASRPAEGYDDDDDSRAAALPVASKKKEDAGGGAASSSS